MYQNENDRKAKLIINWELVVLISMELLFLLDMELWKLLIHFIWVFFLRIIGDWVSRAVFWMPKEYDLCGSVTLCDKLQPHQHKRI